MKGSAEVAAYYFPNYHVDARNEEWHGKGWTEWELVKAATPRFQGHEQPKVPLWGYEDEADPRVMGRKMVAAAEHGIDCFIFDWYWYDNRPYLHRALEEGFLRAANPNGLKFALMWANHDWLEIHPATRCRPYPQRTTGAASEREFLDATDYMIEKYFNSESYWRVNGGLYFSIYDLPSLLAGFGNSVEETRRQLDRFRERVREAGLGELHLNAIVWAVPNLPSEQKVENLNDLINRLGFDSATSYVWIHHHEIPEFPAYTYAKFRELSVRDFDIFTQEYELPYFPNVSMGWDSSPRTIRTDRFDHLGYPFTPILTGNTPEEFKLALQQAKEFLDEGVTNPKILTINSWNEWTEGSYLEPDTRYGMAYLEAIRDVFGQ
ncbi:glycoside hydrolase family 99-like domain-containing protein [Cohnella zeiphila]|uniref:Glycoside hydrolase family 99-like domain-containing protein n=1 Tax=Cohnella zeiphila TaxID=2761120 RepID=A0A7X0SNL3_9BACL|nr:glycoside hydrolase family 99-like domain-containing protein [Cohnella zeiphila]MBB6732164.1 glycoside hydrolase family 99-like domain-containing protein [Cohnella zeiphila]